MTDAENLRLVGQGSASGTPTNPPSETTNVSKKVPSTQAEPTGPAVRKILKVSPVVPKNATGTKDSVKITNRPTSSTGNPTRADQVPLELRSMIEAEERRAAQTASNLTLCTAAINGVENALSALANEGNRQYVDAMKAHFRAAVAQFMTMGPGVSPNLPPRPPRPANNVTFWENPPAGSTSRQPVQIIEPTTAEPGPKSSWATVTKRGQQISSVSANSGRAPSTRPSPHRAPAKTTASPRQDERLFLRLDKDHEWRQLSPAGVREAVAKHLGLLPVIIEHVHRVPSGFGLTAKDKETRQSLLDSAEAFTTLGAKLEEASDLVVLRISTVPLALNTVMGRLIVSEELIRDEILRVTDTIPLKVRPHGKSRLGAPFQSWLAHFEKASAPRPGFRLFDESGVAVRHQSQRTVQQCKRCLEFHGTRGCSRAPACWNCSSKMHSTSDCKAHTKCRNCGGPHRSDSRSCLARPTRSGPVTKEQMVTIRQASQREFAAVARAKAAVRRAEAAATAEKQTTTSLPAISSSNQFEVLAEDLTLPDAEDSGENNPRTQL